MLAPTHTVDSITAEELCDPGLFSQRKCNPQVNAVVRNRLLNRASVRFEVYMRCGKLLFGSIKIDDVSYEHDAVIDRGDVLKRKKKGSQKCWKKFRHTPLSLEEKIPWKCKVLVLGTGNYKGLPVMKEGKT